MGVDRISRDELVAAIDRYSRDELTAFEFDEAIFEIRDRTRDETVQRVVDILWHFYDDCQDHKVVANRAGWNYWQRLRLLLLSDATLEYSERRIWSVAQIIAGMAVAAFLWAVYATGVGQHLLIVAIPFGLLSIGLSAWRRRLYRNTLDWDVTLHPFASMGQLFLVGRSATGFQKVRYRPELAGRRFRDAGSEFLFRLQMYAPWLLLGPVGLLCQVFPISIPIHRVITE